MMDEVIPGLWIGDLPSALNVEKLKVNNIFSILSAMRGRITVNEVRTSSEHASYVDRSFLDSTDKFIFLRPSFDTKF